ncbi:MAG: TonB-dependent receptor plug domain-containing protein [Roseivirga sp.]|nr:TonB-dependent receptor plug domain-containing protein [Roseivirga sp.]
MRTKLQGLLVSLILAVPFLFVSDSPGDFEDLLANLEKQTYDYVQEKVYLHLDKSDYALGEDLWFKAYTVAGPNHTPTPLSHNLHVELINPEMRVVRRHTVYLDKGMGKGDFAIADSLKAGTYTLRAYTNWMRNFDEGFYFKKQIKILDPLAGNNSNTPGEPPPLEMQFFPEGGDLLAGVPVRVAFELNAHKELAGRIVNGRGGEVLSFYTSHNGRGLFKIIPEKDEKYYAQLEDGTRFALPPIKQEGLALSVDNLSDQDNILVKAQTANTFMKNEAYLVIHTRGLVGFASKLEWKGSTANVKVPRKSLVAGVVHATLFNKEWMPEAERVIFQKQDLSSFKVSISTDKASYGPRDSTTLKLKVTNSLNEPIQGFFSLNVFDTNQLKPEAFKEHIESSLLLSSDIKGEIDNAAQYFNTENEQAASQLDLLLMCRGWSRFTWKDLLNDKFSTLGHQVEQGFNIKGKVTLRDSKKPAPRATVKQVGVFEGIPIFAEAIANRNGEFEMKNLHYYAGDGALKAKDRKNRDNVAVRLDTTLDFERQLMVPVRSGIGTATSNVDQEYLTGIKEREQIERAYSLDSSYTDLGTVVVEADAHQQKFTDMQRGLVFNRGEYGVNATDLMVKGQKFVNALFILQGRLPGFNITLGDAGEPNVQMTRKVWSIRNPDPPIQYYIDDAPASLAAVTSLPAERIERVDVLKGMRATSIFGPSANGGALLFYTKTQEEYNDYLTRLAENKIILDKSTMSIQSGYYKSRQFYKVDYRGDLKNEVKPDRRGLIHWEPMIVTDENGEAIITWFNADLETNIHINLEGIWAGGVPLRASAEYKVEK